MYKEYEKKYLEHKRRIILDYVNKFNEENQNNVFSLGLNQDDFSFEKNFCNSDMCSICRGSCCRRAPCIFSPYDFLDINDIDYMKNILDTGLICISILPEDHEILVLRPRGIHDKKSVFSFTTRLNPCFLCGISGCMLKTQYRPSQGLLYVPNTDDRGFTYHSIIYSPDKCAEDYKKYQSILKNLIREYSDKNIPYCYDIIEESVNDLVKKLTNRDK